MNTQFSQPKGSTGKETNKDSIARVLNLKKSEVAYVSVGQPLDGYRVLYDKASNSSYWLPNDIPMGASIIAFTDGLLSHTAGSVQCENTHSPRTWNTGLFVSNSTQQIKFENSLFIFIGNTPHTISGESPLLDGGVWSIDNPTGVWVDISSNSFKESLKNYQGKFSKSVLNSGGLNDKTTDNTTLIQSLINATTSGYILIEYGCKWNYALITPKDEVQLIDMSGYNPVSNQWGAQINYYLRTSEPEKKNAHEFQIAAHHHPAVIINNLGTGIAYRTSIVFRLAGETQWRFGMGISDTDTDFVLASKYSNGTTVTYPGRMYVSASSDSISFNTALVPGVSFNYGTRTWTDNIIVRYNSRTDKGTFFQFYTGTTTSTQSHMVAYNPDGSITFSQNGKNTLFIGVNGEMYGNRRALVDRTTSTNIVDTYAGRVITNTGSTSAITCTLPTALRGKCFEFAVVVPLNITIRPETTGTDIIRHATSNRIDSTTVGSIIKLLCIVDGIWDVAYENGTWTM